MVYTMDAFPVYGTRISKDIIDPVIKDLCDVPFLDPESVEGIWKRSPTPMLVGYPLDPVIMPKAISWASVRPVPDFEMSNNVFVVSEAVRDLVEQFEPGIHQFLPLDVYRRKEKVPFTRHYWMIVCRRIVSVDPEHTTHRQDPTGIWYPLPGGKFVFSRAAIGGAHLWRDADVVLSVLCSQALGDAFRAAGFSGLQLIQREEV